MKRFSLFLKMLLLLVVGWGAPCAFVQAQIVIDAIGDAIDLAELENGSQTPVVIRAGGNSLSDTNYGFVWYRSTGTKRFLIDTSKATVASMTSYDGDATAYTFVLEKTTEGKIRVRENVTNGYIPQYARGSNGGFSSIDGGNSLAGYFNYALATEVYNILTGSAYTLTANLNNGLPVNKVGNEFQVGNSSTMLPLQFYTYQVASHYDIILRNLESLQSNLSALYTPEALYDVQSVLRSPTASDSEKAAAVTAFYASADGKEITLQNHYGYNGQGPEYMYLNGINLSTTTTPDACKATFIIESAGEDTYRLKSAFNGAYVASTPGRSTQITCNKPMEEAGTYRIRHYPNAVDHFALDCTNTTSGDSYVSLHRAGGHGIVTWASDADASRWTIEPAHSVNVKYVTDGDIQLPAEGLAYYWEGETTITPAIYDGYDVTPEVANISDGDITFTYSLKTSTDFFEVAKDYGSITHWYFVSLHSDLNYLKYVAGQSQIPLNGNHRTLPATAEAHPYLWSFVQSGTANRFKIVNKVAGDGMVLSNTKNFTDQEAGNVCPVLKDITTLTDADCDRYGVQRSGSIAGANGFNIFCDRSNAGTIRMNRNGGKLAFWSGADAGSTFIATEASFTTICCVDAEGNALREPLSPILPVGTYPAPDIEGYDYVGYTMDDNVHDGAEHPVLLGGTHILKFRYKQKEYAVTYKYYRLDPKEDTPHYTKTYEGLHFGDLLPAPDHELHDGLQLVKIPTGTVVGNREYSIYCHGDNYEPAPDPELPERVNVTYRYLFGDREMMVGTPQNVANGDNMPALDQLPAFVQCNAPHGSVHYYEDTVIDLNVTFTLPFKSFESFDKITEWCNLSIANAKLLFNYNEADTYMTLSESGVKKDDKYLFAFVGDPFHGYRIYNKAAGEGKILSATDPNIPVGGGKNTGEDSTPIMKDESDLPTGYNILWELRPNGSNFVIRRKGDAAGYLNNRADAVAGKNVLAFWTHQNSATDSGSTVYISTIDLTLGASTTQNAVPTGSAPTSGKVYRIYSAYNDIRGHMISEKKPEGEEITTNGRMYLTRAKTVRDRSQMWMAVEQNAETHSFQLINLESGRYMQVGSNTNENATNVYLLPTQATPTTYGICSKVDGSGNSLNTNANLPVTTWGWNSNGTSNVGSNWVFEEVEYGTDGEFSLQELKDRVLGFSPYARLESGKYYRLKNDNHTTLYMAENFLGDKKVRAVEENTMANPYGAVWKIEGTTEDGFTLTNALTTHVIAQQNGWNAQYPTAESGAKTFFVVADGGSDVAAPRYAFCPNDPHGTTNAAYSLHCQAGGNVLNWNYRDDNGALAAASFWYLEEVDVPSEADLAKVYSDILAANATVNAINASSAEISEKLSAYFADAACSRLQSQYLSISDASLRVLMEDDNLPAALQNIIICVKDGKWEATKDHTYNDYVGRFRIADYAPYSDRNAWNSKLRISATCYLTNPTGITVRSGEVVYLFVDEAPKEGAVLNLEIVEDTNAGASANLGSLHKGLNVFTATTTGELFVNYKVADTEKYLERARDLDGVWHDPDYHPIKIHIEGGTANGYWDLSRKMTAEDWEWLCNNMFYSDFLHIKGNNTLLCLLTRNCRYADHIVEAMKVYDFIYTQELKYIGHDGQFDGRYKPSVTIRDSYSGLFWNGNCANLAGHGIDYRSLISASYWGICHEVAHGIQDVFNLAGLTEVTNNALVQMINHDFGVKSSRGISVKALLEYKNSGATWIDVLRSGNVTWATNHLFFQLYLYFEHAGHMPGFMGRVCDKLREWGGIHQHVQNRVMRYDEDYLMFAKACAEVSQTDLYDFFDAWGFFGYSEDSRSTHDQDRKAEHIYYIGDYGSVSLRQPSRNNEADYQYVEELKTYMKSRPNKAPNLLFINDRLKHDGWVVSDTCAAAKIDPSVIGQPVGYIDSWEDGDFGMFYDFGADQQGSDIHLDLNESTLTVSGDGIVGVKLCDAEGNNRYVYNKREIILTDAIVQQIADGSLRIVVALGNNSDLPILSNVDDLNGDGLVTIADLALLIDYANRCRNYTPTQIEELRGKILNM